MYVYLKYTPEFQVHLIKGNLGLKSFCHVQYTDLKVNNDIPCPQKEICHIYIHVNQRKMPSKFSHKHSQTIVLRFGEQINPRKIEMHKIFQYNIYKKIKVTFMSSSDNLVPSSRSKNYDIRINLQVYDVITSLC